MGREPEFDAKLDEMLDQILSEQERSSIRQEHRKAVRNRPCPVFMIPASSAIADSGKHASF
jgi:hypothetical protein